MGTARLVVQQTASDVTWTDALGAIGAVTTPLAVAVIGYLLSRQLKQIEARQWRSHELIAARLRYYREIAEPLNDLMCYFTFVGSWKNRTPPDVIALKRSTDRTFYTLSPFFGVEVARCYDAFMSKCFETFGQWGDDARLKTSFRRRRGVSPVPWEPEWDKMFTYDSGKPIPTDDLELIKAAYNELLARLVDDIQLTDARTNYASAKAVLSA